jgi:hypothetical protein
MSLSAQVREMTPEQMRSVLYFLIGYNPVAVRKAMREVDEDRRLDRIADAYNGEADE